MPIILGWESPVFFLKNREETTTNMVTFTPYFLRVFTSLDVPTQVRTRQRTRSWKLICRTWTRKSQYPPHRVQLHWASRWKTPTLSRFRCFIQHHKGQVRFVFMSRLYHRLNKARCFSSLESWLVVLVDRCCHSQPFFGINKIWPPYVSTGKTPIRKHHGCCNFSWSSWRKKEHTGKPRHDPDIQHLPAIAVTPEIFKKPSPDTQKKGWKGWEDLFHGSDGLWLTYDILNYSWFAFDLGNMDKQDPLELNMKKQPIWR